MKRASKRRSKRAKASKARKLERPAASWAQLCCLWRCQPTLKSLENHLRSLPGRGRRVWALPPLARASLLLALNPLSRAFHKCELATQSATGNSTSSHWPQPGSATEDSVAACSARTYPEGRADSQRRQDVAYRLKSSPSRAAGTPRAASADAVGGAVGGGTAAATAKCNVTLLAHAPCLLLLQPVAASSPLLRSSCTRRGMHPVAAAVVARCRCPAGTPRCAGGCCRQRQWQL